MKYVITIAFVMIIGCDSNQSILTPTPEPAATAVPSKAISRIVVDDHADEAVATLKRDAYRRENRFLNALNPGYLFDTTRVDQNAIRSGGFTVDELYRLGGQLFDLSFTPKEGLGTKRLQSFRRVHDGDTANIDAMRCSACHWRGGEAGAGDAADNVYFDGDGDRPGSGLERNAPSLAGAGALELAAAALTADLKSRRNELLEFAKNAGYAVRETLAAQGIQFGHITVRPNGSVDMSEVVGVDPDLVVKPFGRKGRFAKIRDMVEESLFKHHGLQSTWMVKNWPPKRLGNGPMNDPDGDGVKDEITEGQVTVLTVYLALQGLPTIEPPKDVRLSTTWARGRSLFSSIGCADCHVPDITLKTTRYRLSDRETRDFLDIDLAVDGAQPRLGPRAGQTEVTVRLFSDLKRHRMGDTLADSKESYGVAADTFITPPLWGLARSRPYLHDGRAPTIEDAILLHGGEAQRTRDTYAELDENDRSALRIFLISLNRERRFTAR